MKMKLKNLMKSEKKKLMNSIILALIQKKR